MKKSKNLRILSNNIPVEKPVEQIKNLDVQLEDQNLVSSLKEETADAINETVEKKYLTPESMLKLSSSVMQKVRENGAGYYGWKNAPELLENGSWTQEQGWGDSAENVNITSQQAKDIYEEKLNGAYGERFVMSLGLVNALVGNGYTVRLVQFQNEEGVPFDASGWTVMVVDSMPMFHISPDDLVAAELDGIVEVLSDNNAPDVSWKETNKVGEFEALLSGSMQPGLDLVSIAQQGSK